MLIRPFIAATILTTITTTAAADSSIDVLRDEALITIQQSFNHRDPSVESLLERIGWRFDWADIDGGGISASDEAIARQADAASERRQIVTNFLFHDMNGDNVVTLDEFRTRDRISNFLSNSGGRLREYPGHEHLAQKFASKLKRDRYARPGEILFDEETTSLTLDEVLERALTIHPAVPDTPTEKDHPFLKLDSNGDGITTREEALSSIVSLLNEFDIDRSQSFSKKQTAMFADLAREAAQRKKERFFVALTEHRVAELDDICKLPKVTEAVQSLWFGSRTPRATATITTDKVDATRFAELTIEEGDTPLYLVVESQSPTIFRITGKIDRLKNVIAFNQSAVVGVRPEIVSTASTECMKAIQQISRTARNSNPMSALFGQDIKNKVWVPYPSRVSLPSGSNDIESQLDGQMTLAVDSKAGPVWRDFLRFSPSGLIDLKPSDVVSRKDFHKPELFPHFAGLARQIETGALELLSEETPLIDHEGNAGIAGAGGGVGMHRDEIYYAVDFDDVVRGRPRHRIRIKKAIKLPEGLGGARQVIFVLPEGVPEPIGDLGRSEIIADE